MKQLSLTEARAKLARWWREVDKGKGPIAIAQRSKVKALLVDPEWHGRVEEELAPLSEPLETITRETSGQHDFDGRSGRSAKRS